MICPSIIRASTPCSAVIADLPCRWAVSSDFRPLRGIRPLTTSEPVEFPRAAGLLTSLSKPDSLRRRGSSCHRRPDEQRQSKPCKKPIVDSDAGLKPTLPVSLMPKSLQLLDV